jgi:hypothetical protein
MSAKVAVRAMNLPPMVVPRKRMLLRKPSQRSRLLFRNLLFLLDLLRRNPKLQTEPKTRTKRKEPRKEDRAKKKRRRKRKKKQRKKTKLKEGVEVLIPGPPFHPVMTTIMTRTHLADLSVLTRTKMSAKVAVRAMNLPPMVVPRKRKLVLNRLLKQSLDRTGDNDHKCLKAGNDECF